jgi:hypothetical protein
MNIPQNVKIGSIVYSVVMENVKHEGLSENNNWGKINFDECKIYLNDTLADQKIPEVFFHEVLHGIEHHFCMDLKEVEIDRLSHGITAFLKENNLLKD